LPRTPLPVEFKACLAPRAMTSERGISGSSRPTLLLTFFGQSNVETESFIE